MQMICVTNEECSFFLKLKKFDICSNFINFELFEAKMLAYTSLFFIIIYYNCNASIYKFYMKPNYVSDYDLNLLLIKMIFIR